MMFAAGMVIGAVCGVCIMCVVSCKRAEQYESMQRYLESRWHEALKEVDIYKTLHKQASAAYSALKLEILTQSTENKNTAL